MNKTQTSFRKPRFDQHIHLFQQAQQQALHSKGKDKLTNTPGPRVKFNNKIPYEKPEHNNNNNTDNIQKHKENAQTKLLDNIDKLSNLSFRKTKTRKFFDENEK